MKCDKCKWANWNRTKNGRLHPDKGGRCTKEVVIPELPLAFHYLGSYPVPRVNCGPHKPSWLYSGGFIYRGKKHNNICVYYEEEQSK